jgi:protein O-GlcNAc transferase
MPQPIQIAMQHHQAGRLGEAENIYRQILSGHPDHFDALHLLGTLAIQAGRPDEAVELIGRAIRLNPNFAETHANLGSALAKTGKFEEAIAAFREGVRLSSGVAEMHVNLARALNSNRRIDEAITSYRHAVRLKPGIAGTHHSLAQAFASVGRFDEAIAAFAEAIRLKPDNFEAYYDLANVCKDTGRFDEAVAFYREAIRLKPDLAEAHGNLGSVLKNIGQFDEAIACFRQSLRLKPDYDISHSALVFALNHQPDRDPGEILSEHVKWSDQHARPLMAEIIPHSNDRSPDRRLRIGYVSGDFRRHSVANFFLPLLEHHDKQIVEVFCYANVQHPDDMSERMKVACDAWCDIFGLADDAVAKKIRSDEIDILVDLSGHTAGNRLRVFARKPAPIQVTYLGYANTTGMTAIDYRLTDALADPPGMTDHLNAEKLWRLPGCAWCYHPPEGAPDIQLRGDGPITFGCFNAFAKINPGLTAIWAELLKRVPGSRLLLKSAGAGVASARQRLIGQFTEHGIAAERIEMLGHIADPRRHLELYGRVDVALDTYPYHGTTTTCEAMWMGVPVVTLAGRTHVSRVGVSLLSCIGLPDLIANTPEEYLSIASDLAMNSERLQTLRAGLRNKIKSSPLVDGARFSVDVESAYRQMWRKWCAAGGGSRL